MIEKPAPDAAVLTEQSTDRSALAGAINSAIEATICEATAALMQEAAQGFRGRRQVEWLRIAATVIECERTGIRRRVLAKIAAPAPAAPAPSPAESRSRRSFPSSTFVDGWLTTRFERGEIPNYGYPKNHLPDTTVESINVTTGFLAGAKSK